MSVATTFQRDDGGQARIQVLELHRPNGQGRHIPRRQNVVQTLAHDPVNEVAHSLRFELTASEQKPSQPRQGVRGAKRP